MAEMLSTCCELYHYISSLELQYDWSDWHYNATVLQSYNSLSKSFLLYIYGTLYVITHSVSLNSEWIASTSNLQQNSP